jgi:putative hydrolase of the HAD superfamily
MTIREPTPPRCVVFDIDDTLYLERDYVRSGFEAVDVWVAREFGIRGFLDAAWAQFLAGRRGDVFDVVLREHGVEPSEDVVRGMVECYRTHQPRIELLRDAAALIEQLRGRVRLAAVTDGPLESQRAKVEALDVHAWADLVVLTMELGPGFGKPHPRAFEVVEERLGTHGSDNVYLADNPGKDFVAPHAMGWRTVRVRRPESLHAATRGDDDVDFEVTDLATVAELLGVDPEAATAS